MKVSVTEYRVGRNFIRVGDCVKVVLPGKTQRKETRVIAIRAEDGEAVEVDVVDPKTRAVRTVRPERVERMAQTKCGEKREAKV